MLSRRIVTAAVGLPILAAAVIMGGFLFAVLATWAAAVGAWELCRMVKAWGQPPYARVAVAAAAAYAGTPMWIDFAAPSWLWVAVADSRGLWMAASLGGVALSALMLLRGRGGGARGGRAAVTLWVVLLIGGTMFHAAALRDAPDGAVWDGADGAVWTLFALATTFAADTGAYFAGRAFGSRKLAPSVSPNKTWEGAVGGLLAAAAVGAALGALLANGDQPPQVYTRQTVSPALVALAAGAAGAALAVVGLFGDLCVSKLKRRAGFDDSGTLFPGHGGILDRMDSLMFTVTATAWLAMVF